MTPRLLAAYLLLGAVLSVAMYATSRTRLPLRRELAAHLAIILFWPFVLFYVVRLLLEDDISGKTETDVSKCHVVKEGQGAHGKHGEG